MSKERKSFGWRIYLSAKIFCPYRISPLGAHIDHQYGKIHELAYAFGGHERGDRELPIGGLSSSAAVIIAFLVALCRVNHIQLEPMELILMAKAAENKYVGVNCGKLDQSCEILRETDVGCLRESKVAGESDERIVM